MNSVHHPLEAQTLCRKSKLLKYVRGRMNRLRNTYFVKLFEILAITELCCNIFPINSMDTLGIDNL